MIGRRGIIGLLLGAPVMAGRVAEEIGSGAVGATIGNSPVAYDVPEEGSPLEILYRQRRHVAEREFRWKQNAAMYMPPHIANKKSWSDTFKMKVWVEEQRAFEENWSWDINDPETMKRALRMIGVRFD